MFTTLVSAQIAGKVGNRNAKMPGSGHSLPPSLCKSGSKLAKVPGSVCFGCYAKKSEAMYTSVRVGWKDNYFKAVHMIANHPEQWAKAMAYQIKHFAEKNGENYHRWFEAGDLQSVEMLKAIVMVCELTPNIKHWLPTREYAIVKAWRKAGGVEPSNLVIRMSSVMVGDKPLPYEHTSTVHRKGEKGVGHNCPANTAKHRALHPEGKGNCGPCRKCWSKKVANVSYPYHR